ncbi:ABC transporter permease [Galbitalea soli]|uniref:Transport permease protein n=1 Tax=Galbitalea soli TaxID=1268042 RepID=A0A7C9TPF3_9MICO|nr:ABC transporter permease [Galbitalea soli]NEM90676.1 ABC transporter permease [Galbitalea soli]NYJ31394.1 ABC transporter DrrB family efflux protein [Galbitalea soli]
MNGRRTIATTVRVLTQVRHDPRTIALLLLVPSLLIGLMSWIFSGTSVFEVVGPALLGLFPFTVMFLITSITTLRERRGGTLERLMTMPMGRADFILGYALAFGLIAVVQALIAVGYAVWVCGLTVAGDPWLLVLVAVVNALLGTTLGLFVSAFARTEFQVVQFMPALVFPQILLGGIFIPRDRMPDVLRIISDWLPLSHSIAALQKVAADANSTSEVLGELAIVGWFALAFVVLASITLRRQTR